MKVALVHDYIKEYGGAERVLEALHEVWPDAPVFTLVYLPEFLGPHKERFKNWDIRPSAFQQVPYAAKLVSPLRIIAPFLFEQFDFSEYDVVIVSATGAYSPNIINKKNALHICYSHTPPRYLYGFATAREWKKNVVFRVMGELANHFLRLVDFTSAQKVDYFVANSKNIQGRIKKFYKRDATVIYPPVNVNSEFRIKSSELKNRKGSYFLAGGRLARPKHIDLIVKACEELKVPLKVFGKGFAGYEDEIKSSKFRAQSSKIEFLGEVTDEEKLELMRGAKAYVFASEDEDFGITPVEAMGQGLPVIAYRSGGVLESIIGGKTGIFFDNLSTDSLKAAILEFGKLKFRKEDLSKQAEKFSTERFKKEIEAFVSKVTHEKKD